MKRGEPPLRVSVVFEVNSIIRDKHNPEVFWFWITNVSDGSSDWCDVAFSASYSRSDSISDPIRRVVDFMQRIGAIEDPHPVEAVV